MSTEPPGGRAIAVDATGLSRRYGRRWALVDVSFQLPEGRVLLVAGRNGSGKSTLFRVLATAIRAHMGSASILGSSLSERESVRRKVALLGHSSFTYESLSARENLDLAARFLDVTPESVSRVLHTVGLDGRSGDRVDTFSAGMRKRLMIARTLLQDAPVVLLDEPYGQLDPEGFAMIDQLIPHLRQAGRTVLIATHMVERVARLADHAMRLENGSVIWRGAASDLSSSRGDESEELA